MLPVLPGRKWRYGAMSPCSDFRAERTSRVPSSFGVTVTSIVYQFGPSTATVAVLPARTSTLGEAKGALSCDSVALTLYMPVEAIEELAPHITAAARSRKAT